MKAITALLSLSALLVVASCATPIRPVYQPRVEPGEGAKIEIERSSEFNTAAIMAIFGANGGDYFIIPKGKKTTFRFKAGEHELFVRTNQGNRPFN